MDGPLTSPPLLLFPAAGRTERLQQARDRSGPREFFYGYLGLSDRGQPLDLADSRKDPDGPLARLELAYVRGRNTITNLGLARSRVLALRPELERHDIALSFTDAFSLSLGFYRNMLRPAPLLVGGFHGLADLIDEVRRPFRGWARSRIARGLAGLDHLFFFGDADRRRSIELYNLPEPRTSVFPFGVDTDFWCPGEVESDLPQRDFVLSVGSDPKRDYATLLAADIGAPLHIVTRLPISVPSGRSDVEIIRGSYHNIKIDDRMLRDLYRAASVVAVSVRDVFQPSGYSVTLQAMACGKPVVLSNIRGLWDRQAYQDGDNCVLVAPGDPAALGEAVRRLLRDDEMRTRIGAAARRSATQTFALGRMDDGLDALIARVAAEGPRLTGKAR